MTAPQTFDVGDALSANVAFSVGETATDPTTVVATVRSPDGILTAFTYGVGTSIVRDDEGVYSLVVVPDVPGAWVVRWVGTGAVADTTETIYAVRPTAATAAGIGLAFYGGDPANSGRDQVRLLIGDRNPDDLQFTDTEVDWMLAEAGEAPLVAAVRACRALQARYARDMDASNGDVSKSYSQRASAYGALATAYAADLAALPSVVAQAVVPVPYAGGATNESVFSLGMFDNPSAAGRGYTDPRAG